MRRMILVFSLAWLGAAGVSAQTSSTARRSNVEDVLHGERVADPYRWLEELQSPETRAWAAAQDSAARAWVAGPERDRWRARIERLAAVRPISPPWERSGQLFYTRYNTTGGSADVTLVVRRGRDGASRDVNLSSDPAQSPVRRIMPAHRAALTIYATGIESSSWQVWGLYDIAAGRMLTDTLRDVHTASAAAWAPGDRSFYYSRYRTPPPDSLGTARLAARGLYLHRIGTAQSADSLVHAATDESCVLTPFTPEAGSVVVVHEFCAGGVNSLVALTTAGRQTLASGQELVYRFAGSVADTMYWQTNADAPNHKVVSLHFDGGNAEWQTVVAEAEQPLFAWSSGPLGANLVGHTLLLAYQKDAVAAIKAYDLETRALRDIELPAIGSIWSGFVGSPYSNDGFYSISGVADPGSVYHIDVRTGTSRLWERTPIDLPLDSILTEQVFVTAPDGTRFPMFVVRRMDTSLDGTAPAWIYGYGFGDWSASPWFQPYIAEFINQGGVWALPNIRGGAEYGERWSTAGSRENKQNSVSDYIAASRYLIEHRYTAARRIVANASSAGGVVAAAAMIQEPALYGALVLDYPVLDMLRYHLFTVASTWKGEYGTVETASEFKVLRSISAPHTLEPGTCYPPVLVAPGEGDAVTPPFHAYKFVAALQHAKGCNTHPALLRVSWGAGHNAGRTLTDRLDNWADQLAFVDKALKPGRRISTRTLPEIVKRGTGPVSMILIPCASCRWKSLEPFMARNDSVFTMYAVTLPGYGGTRVPDLPFESDSTPWRDNVLAALGHLLDREGLRNVIVVGHSQGGQIAVQLANARRDRIRGVVNVDGGIVSSPAFDPLTRGERVELARGALLQYGENMLYDADYWQSFNTARLSDPERARLHHGWFMATDRDVVMAYWREGILIDMTKGVRSLRQPLLDLKAIPPRITNVDSARAAYAGMMDRVTGNLAYERVFLEQTLHYVLETPVADTIIRRFAREVASAPATAAQAPPGRFGEVVRRGSGAPTLVLMPCLGCDWRAWDEFMARNEDRYTMLAVTWPGMGDTPLPRVASGSPTPLWANLDSALVQLVRDQQLSRPVLVAHSAAAVQAVDFAIARPDLVAGVVAVDATITNRDTFGYSAAQRRRWAETEMHDVLSKYDNDSAWIRLNTAAAGVPRSGHYTRMWLTPPREHVLRYWREWLQVDVGSRLPAIRVPLLALHAISASDNDSAATRDAIQARYQRAGVPANVQVEFVESSGHSIWEYQPGAFDDALWRFLQRTAGTGANPVSAAGNRR